MYSFFWVIPRRLKFCSRRVPKRRHIKWPMKIEQCVCLFHLHSSHDLRRWNSVFRNVGTKLPMNMEQSVPKRRYIKWKTKMERCVCVCLFHLYRSHGLRRWNRVFRNVGTQNDLWRWNSMSVCSVFIGHMAYEDKTECSETSAQNYLWRWNRQCCET
jgi:hypothetical protein